MLYFKVRIRNINIKYAKSERPLDKCRYFSPQCARSGPDLHLGCGSLHARLLEWPRFLSPSSTACDPSAPGTSSAASTASAASASTAATSHSPAATAAAAIAAATATAALAAAAGAT